MRKLLAISLVLTMAAAANAAVIEQIDVPSAYGTCRVTVDGVVSPSDANFMTYTINLTMLNGDYVLGWDGAITGSINQQYPFGTTPAVFMDNNHLFNYDPMAFLDLDSQYLYETTSKDATNGVIVASNAEDATQLTASFALKGMRANPNAGASADLAQVCSPASASFTIFGNVLGEVLVRDENDFQYVVPIPEPATMALLALGGLVMARRRRR